MNNKSWIVFLGLGLLFLIYALHNLIWLPFFREASNWNWLGGDQEVIQFINLSFQAQGIWVLGFAFFVVFTAVTWPPPAQTAPSTFTSYLSMN